LFTFGFVESLTHEMRDSALVLDGFFVIGLLLLVSLSIFETGLQPAKTVIV
jgi:UMF1 family MFS transporter